ncbi:MAG TPA: Gfo/Idh/MocA family oxidoreductase [Burkholderiales bacterium]|nr:Gfo/Idh/MocA family oxidoreductase [Burkholderiales bacterium]
MKRLRLGVVGLGRAFSVMAPAFRDPRIEVVSASDPRPEALGQFERDFGGRTFPTIESLCRSDIDAVYIATPHQFHAAQAVTCLSFGKHVLVEKPMALSLDECRDMIAAAERAGTHVVVGHSHSFDAPIRRTRALIESGEFGRVRMITALNFTDFLYRPRRPEELDTAQGGGAVFNQAAHQVDIVRLLGGGRVATVRALTGAWDPARPTEGAYSCVLSFEDGAFASLAYSGYAHFDSDEWCNWIGELGRKKDPGTYGGARKLLADGDEAALKSRRNYGGNDYSAPAASFHQHFGVFVVSCDRADLRPLPEGIMIYADGERRLDPLPTPRTPRVEVIDELYDAIVAEKPPLHSARWAMATLEVCLAMLRSAREGKDIPLANQSGLPT